MVILSNYLKLPIFFYVATMSLMSCSYRFTNLRVTPPSGISSIAVESIFDSSQKVLPHELLWESVQREFIKNGRLKVTSSKNADAYVKLQISDAYSIQQTERLIQPKIDEKKLLSTNKETPSPKDFRNLTRAGSIADEESQAFSVYVEIWSLKTGDLLFKNKYILNSGRYKIIDNSTTVENQFLRAEETYKYNFQNLTDQVARNIVSDFIRTR